MLGLDVINFVPDEKMKHFFKAANKPGEKIKQSTSRKSIYLLLLLLGLVFVVIFQFTKPKITANDLSVEQIERKLENFEFDSTSKATKEEAKRILIHIGIDENDIEVYPDVLIGKIDKVNELAIWVGSYKKDVVYGVRYGKSDRKYIGSNDTYFEISP